MPRYTHFLPKHYVTALVAGDRLERLREKSVWQAADVMGEVLRMESEIIAALAGTPQAADFAHGDLQMAQTSLDRALVTMARTGPGGRALVELEEGALKPRRTNVYRLTEDGRSRVGHELMNLAVRPQSPYPSRVEILDALLGGADPAPTPAPAVAGPAGTTTFAFCPYCGASAVDDARFCWQCGKALSSS